MNVKTYHLLSTFSNCSNKTLCLTFELLNICGAARDEMSRNVDLPNFAADLLTRHELLKMTMMRSGRGFWFIYYAFSRYVVTLRNYFMNDYKMKDDWWINMTWKPRGLKKTSGQHHFDWRSPPYTRQYGTTNLFILICYKHCHSYSNMSIYSFYLTCLI